MISIDEGWKDVVSESSKAVHESNLTFAPKFRRHPRHLLHLDSTAHVNRHAYHMSKCGYCMSKP